MKKYSLLAICALIFASLACGSSADIEVTQVIVDVTIKPVITSTPTLESPTPENTETPIPKEEYVLLFDAAPYSVFLDHNTDRGNGKGINVYLDDDGKRFIFEIIGGSPNCPAMPSGQAYLVRYEDGTEEWRDRQAVENPLTYVKNDSTLLLHDWTFYESCP